MTDNGNGHTPEQLPVVLAQIILMPNGQLQVSIAPGMPDVAGFCMGTARTFLEIAMKQHAEAQPVTRSQILVPPPGTRLPDGPRAVGVEPRGPYRKAKR